jgi:hypothetical protein
MPIVLSDYIKDVSEAGATSDIRERMVLREGTFEVSPFTCDGGRRFSFQNVMYFKYTYDDGV